MGVLNPLTVTRGDYRYARRRYPVTCLSGDVVGTPVYITGPPTADTWAVASIDPSDEDKMPAVGILIEKYTATTGEVMIGGLVTGVYSGLTPGRQYYAVNGGISLTEPTGVEQIIGVAQDEDVLWLPGNLSGDSSIGSGERVLVACLSTDNVGDVMCMRDVRTATGRWRVQKCDPLDFDKMPGVGILESKTTPTTGIMIRIGSFEGVYTGLDVLKQLFVGLDGRLTQTMPPSGGNLIMIQKFGFLIDTDCVWLTGEIGSMIIRRS